MSKTYKVGYIFLNGLCESLKDEIIYKFDDSITLSRHYPNINESVWKGWLGLQWDEIKESNLIIEIKIPTSTPEVFDDENKEIERVCRKIWVSCMLTGSFHLVNAYFLTGSEIDKEVKIRSYFQFDKWFHTNQYAVDMCNEHLVQWSSLYKKLKFIYSKEDEFLRLKRGLYSFLKGCSEGDITFRLPYHVGVLEALINPSIGKTTNQFISRGEIFWKLCESNNNFSSEEVKKVLKEIYEMRCDFAHMHGMKPAQEEIYFLRCFQCEELGRKAYQQVLLDDSLLNNFIRDIDIVEAWRMGKMASLIGASL